MGNISPAEAVDILKKIVVKQQINNDDDLKAADFSAIFARNDKYNEYITKYIDIFYKRHNAQRRMKWFFFFATLALLIGIVVCSCICMLISANREGDIYNISLLVSSFVGAITSFIVLPKIIANNLFPKSEEDHSDQVFKSMFQYDLKLRHFHQNNQSDKNK